MSHQPRQVSVVISTYNSPEWLNRTLCGYACQTADPFEVVIADDGSGEETRRIVDAFRSQDRFRIRHVWHEDDGFRKCRILNQAIMASSGDYLIFTDGDCVPRADLVSCHINHAQPACFLSGGYYKLPMDVSHQITPQAIESQQAFSIQWLRQAGLPFSHRLLKLHAPGKLTRFLNAVTTTKPSWNGHNASGWKRDLVAAGGFDERMRYGGEDRELGERLENAGIVGKQIRYSAVCVHLDHARGYVNQADLQRNREIRDQTQKLRRTMTEYGLAAA